MSPTGLLAKPRIHDGFGVDGVEAVGIEGRLGGEWRSHCRQQPVDKDEGRSLRSLAVVRDGVCARDSVPDAWSSGKCVRASSPRGENANSSPARTADWQVELRAITRKPRLAYASANSSGPDGSPIAGHLRRSGPRPRMKSLSEFAPARFLAATGAFFMPVTLSEIQRFAVPLWRSSDGQTLHSILPMS